MSVLILHCRPGFEAEVRREAADLLGAGDRSTLSWTSEDGIVRVALDPVSLNLARDLHWKSWMFARQWWIGEPFPQTTDPRELAENFYALGQDALRDAKLHLEYPDTNSGKSWHPRLAALEPILIGELRRLGAQIRPDAPQTLHALFTESLLWMGLSLGRSAPWRMGIPRLRMPSRSPSRSALKLAEAFETLLSETERDLRLRPGMTAVDLGAAPGGWSWFLLQRGLSVTAIDNGPLKGPVATHPRLIHRKEDGFRFHPKRPVDWVVCDMVENPLRVAKLIGNWLSQGWASESIFNLKLPMRRRYETVRQCLEALHQAHCQTRARHLYHDREEITVYARRIGKRRQTSCLAD